MARNQTQMFKVLDVLRSSASLTKYMMKDGSVDFENLKKHLDSDIKMDDIYEERYFGTYIHEGKTFIRALFGQYGRVLEGINYGKYVKYNGKYKIFCITHICLDGLGAINMNRTFNILNVPERCDNKGVKGYIHIDDARQKGLEFWSPTGDRYQNKIFCFDYDIREAIFKIEYVHNYKSPERLMQTHAKNILMMKNFGMNDVEALNHVQSLVISDEEDFNEDFKSLQINQ